MTVEQTEHLFGKWEVSLTEAIDDYEAKTGEVLHIIDNSDIVIDIFIAGLTFYRENFIEAMSKIDEIEHNETKKKFSVIK